MPGGRYPVKKGSYNSKWKYLVQRVHFTNLIGQQRGGRHRILVMKKLTDKQVRGFGRALEKEENLLKRAKDNVESIEERIEALKAILQEHHV